MRPHSATLGLTRVWAFGYHNTATKMTSLSLTSDYRPRAVWPGFCRISCTLFCYAVEARRSFEGAFLTFSTNPSMAEALAVKD